MEENTKRLRGLVSACLQLVGGLTWVVGWFVVNWKAGLVIGGLTLVGWGVFLTRDDG